MECAIIGFGPGVCTSRGLAYFDLSNINLGFALFIIYDALMSRWPWHWANLVAPSGPDKRVGAVLFLHRVATDLTPKLV